VSASAPVCLPASARQGAISVLTAAGAVVRLQTSLPRPHEEWSFSKNQTRKPLASSPQRRKFTIPRNWR